MLPTLSGCSGKFPSCRRLGLGGFSFDFLAAFLSTASPDAKVLKLPNTGHWIPDEQPDETVRLVTEFIG